jgi:flagellar hook-basal body complex protein FliE
VNAIRPVSVEIPALRESGRAAPAGAPGAPGAAGGFAAELGKALSGVEQLQQEGDREAEKVALGGGNLHEAALALEKADVALRLATKVRNKLVEAYQEVMRMNV